MAGCRGRVHARNTEYKPCSFEQLRLKRRTTIPDEAAVERARDLLQRDFAAAPNEKWVSVGSKGDAYDNAMAEAWVATFKSELVDGRRFPSFEHAEHEVLHWIGFYNGERLLEALGDLPPAEYEELNYKTGNRGLVATT
jgi:transposase InsO family protein